MLGMAQTKVAEVTPNGYLSAGKYVYIGGTVADTLKDVDTLTYVLRLNGTQTFDAKAQIFLDHVSGTAGGKLKSYKSIDGVNYVVTAEADSITTSSVTADILDTEELTFSDVMYPYLKFIYIQSGTAVTVPKIYLIAREN
jgi:hypothetical protein